MPRRLASLASLALAGGGDRSDPMHLRDTSRVQTLAVLDEAAAPQDRAAASAIA